MCLETSRAIVCLNVKRYIFSDGELTIVDKKTLIPISHSTLVTKYTGLNCKIIKSCKNIYTRLNESSNAIMDAFKSLCVKLFANVQQKLPSTIMTYDNDIMTSSPTRCRLLLLQ